MPSLDEKIGAVSQRLLGLDSGPLAELRRMEPGGPGTPIFWRLAAEHGFGEGETTQRWMQIVRILAILTPKSHLNPAARLHDRFRQLGRVLCDGGNQAWPSDPKNPRRSPQSLWLRHVTLAPSKERLMLAGRLGLEKARIPHADRHGLVWLERGRLEVEDGCLRFITAGGGDLDPGNYQIPHQAVSIILLGPGSSVTHDALRLLARHGCALAAVGEGAVRSYTAPPLLPDSSAAARSQVTLWADLKSRMEVARAMYAMRFGEFVLTRDIDTLRGQEGARIKRSYQLAAQRFGIPWNGRLYDRANPDASDAPNQALNHAATAMSAAATVAVASLAANPATGLHS